MEISDWINLSLALVTLIGLLVAFTFQYLQIQKLNQQLTIQAFSDYTKRYQEIILEFPENINEPNFVLAQCDSNYAHTMRYMRAYFDLCFEEWHLNQRKLINKQTWNVWKEGMKTALSKSAFKQAWNQIKRDTSFGNEFEVFVERIASIGENQSSMNAAI